MVNNRKKLLKKNYKTLNNIRFENIINYQIEKIKLFLNGYLK